MTSVRTTGLFLLFFLALSCKEDDDKDFATIEGKWRGTRVEMQFKPFGLPIPFSDDNDSFSTLIEFKADGTMIVHEDQPAEGTYQLVDDKLIIDIDLTIEERELAGTYTLQELSESTLIFYTRQENQKVADPNGGPTLKGDIKLTLHFRKVN
jgi:hypothetical protein